MFKRVRHANLINFEYLDVKRKRPLQVLSVVHHNIVSLLYINSRHRRLAKVGNN